MTVQREVQICNARGLHARAARRFVETSLKFQAAVDVAHQERRVRADSVMELLLLVAHKGDVIAIHADGPDAEEAVSTLASLVENRFGEDE